MITFEIPVKLVCSTNARSHWRVIAKRKKEQRELAKILCQSALVMSNGMALRVRQFLPIVVMIDRLGKRRMDSDNLATAAKYVRDGIADALELNDNDERIEWRYGQVLGKEYGCRVHIKQQRSGEANL